MSTFHAVVWIDHQSAQVLQFDPEHVDAQHIKAHSHHTRQHGSDDRHERAFYQQVSDALKDVREILIVGPGTAHADLRKHCAAHAPDVARAIVDTQPCDHPTEAQLVALARQYFLKHDRMSGTPTPM